MTAPNDTAGARLDRIDRQHRTRSFYAGIDSDAVWRLRNAGEAYQRALLAGDDAAADAALSGIKSAEAALQRQRRRQP